MASLDQGVQHVAPGGWRITWPRLFEKQRVTIGAAINWRTVWIEWVAIFAVVFTYCRNILDLGTTRALTGNESEVFQALDYALLNALKFGEFPLWNPYIRTGQPWIADPFLHNLNPFVTLPILMLGVLDGYKVALFLSFLLAAFGMWWLGKVLGMSAPVRVWVALMYCFTGNAVAKFLQGHYDMVFGYAWIPWIIAALIALVMCRRPLYMLIAAASMALLVVSGNVYYAFFLLLILVPFIVVAPLRIQRSHPRVQYDWMAAAALVLTGLLAVGIISVHLLPLLQMQRYLTKATDPQMTGAQTIGQIFLDFTSKDPERPDAIKTVPREEFYAYIGYFPLAALLLLPLALWRGPKRWAIYLILALLVTFSWIDIRDMPWHSIYAESSFLQGFRHPPRIIIFSSAIVFALAGLGLDALWRLLWRARTAEPETARGRQILSWVGLALVGVALVVSVWDIYSTNRQYVTTRDDYAPPWTFMQWLRDHEASPALLAYDANHASAVISNGLRYFDLFYGFNDIRRIDGQINSRAVVPKPHYQVKVSTDPPPTRDAVPLFTYENHTLYKLPQSLPYAFVVKNDALMSGASGELQLSDVSPARSVSSTVNTMQIVASGEANSTLVAFATHYPGWQVTVDGQPQEIQNVSGHLATPLLAGEHTYVFTFSPSGFWVGLAISLLALAVCVGLLAYELTGTRWRFPRRAPARRPVAPAPAAAAAAAAVASDVAPIATADTAASAPAEFGESVDAPVTAAVALPTAEAAALAPAAGETVAGPDVAAAEQPPVAESTSRLRVGGISWVMVLPWVLFAGAVAVYAFTRLFALDKFPIYFFADEAIEAVTASDLIARGWRAADGSWFSPFFNVYGFFNPLVGVYLHALAVEFFGKSVVVTRATSAIVTIFGSISVALMLHWFFKARYWWAGLLFLALTPTWFLHSRTAFETAMMVSFYALFLLFYLLYRYRNPLFLLAAVVFAALTFYSYGNGQIFIGVTGILLFFSDLRYHIKHWRVTAPALVMVAVMAIPFVQWRAQHPEEVLYHLRTLDPYWARDVPLTDKLANLASQYAYMIGPRYWYNPDVPELVRHILKGYGHILIYTFPLFLLGVGVCLYNWRSSAHRLALIALAAAPVSGALTGIGVTRIMGYIIPAAILTTLGLGLLLAWIRRPRAQMVASVLVFLVLSAGSLYMLRDALVNGPLWYRDYGLYGMQWGAQPLFEMAQAYLKQSPDTRVYVTPTWANGTDVFVRFFTPNDGRIQLNNVDNLMSKKQALNSSMVWVMTPEERRKAEASGKFKTIAVDQVLKYPDGSDGFYFARLEYSDKFDQIVAQEKQEQQKPITETVTMDGETVSVSHSKFDTGSLPNVFDNDNFTLVRGLSANPLVFDVTFPKPRRIESLKMVLGSMEPSVTVSLYAPGSNQPVTASQTWHDLPPDPSVELPIPNAPAEVIRARVEIKDLRVPPDVDAHTHVRELHFK